MDLQLCELKDVSLHVLSLIGFSVQSSQDLSSTSSLTICFLLDDPYQGQTELGFEWTL